MDEHLTWENRRMRNPFRRLFRWFEYKLFYERDDVYAPNRKTRSMIHNAFLIQLGAVLIIIGEFASIPFLVWLGLVSNAILYLVILWAIATPTYVITSLYVRRLNKLFEKSITDNR
jgi:hypothetical protein